MTVVTMAVALQTQSLALYYKAIERNNDQYISIIQEVKTTIVCRQIEKQPKLNPGLTSIILQKTDLMISYAGKKIRF
jgi:hypothetical protein